jgi:hypothetical protein
MLYDDGRVACDQAHLLLRRYYLWGDKRLPYSSMASVEEKPLSRGRGAWRIWGSGDFRHWYNLDRTRPDKTVAIEIHTAGWAIPVITPDEPERVYAILVEKTGLPRS